MTTRERLEQMIRTGRLPHALMLTGEIDVSLQEAVWLAQTLCQSKSVQYPDIHFAYPIVQSKDAGVAVCDDLSKVWYEFLANTECAHKAEDWMEQAKLTGKQPLIYERESSEILRKLSLRAYGEFYKVMVIWQADKMNTVCQDKLLKIIEEPPLGTVFVLLTDKPEALLTTIRSRVQEVAVTPTPERERWAQQWQEHYDAMHDLHEQWVTLLRNAWYVGHQKRYDRLQEMRDWVDNDISKAGKEQQKTFLTYCLRELRENFIRNYGSEDLIYQVEEEAEFSQNFARFITSKNVEPLMEFFSIALRQIEQNGNARIVFFDLCLQLIVHLK